MALILPPRTVAIRRRRREIEMSITLTELKAENQRFRLAKALNRLKGRSANNVEGGFDFLVKQKLQQEINRGDFDGLSSDWP